LQTEGSAEPKPPWERCHIFIAGGGMLDEYFGISVISFSEMILRLSIALAFGCLLGLDREVRGISAGVRTHMLVALSSATTMLIALELFENLQFVV
jgi:hypothetical protein